MAVAYVIVNLYSKFNSDYFTLSGLYRVRSDKDIYLMSNKNNKKKRTDEQVIKLGWWMRFWLFLNERLYFYWLCCCCCGCRTKEF